MRIQQGVAMIKILFTYMKKIPKKLSVNTEYVMIKIKNRGNSNKHTNIRIN